MIEYQLSFDEASRHCKIEVSVESVHRAINRISQEIYENLETAGEDGLFVYTGLSGVAYAFLKLHFAGIELSWSRPFDIAFEIIENTFSVAIESTRLNRARPSFLNGEAGYFTIAAIIYNLSRREAKRDQAIGLVVQLGNAAVNRDCENEVLYGSAGYLYAIRLLLSHCPDLSQEVKQNLLQRHRETVEKLVAARRTEKSWEWHGKRYLGAAHGVGGILLNLLHAVQVDPSLASTLLPFLSEELSQLIETGKHEDGTLNYKSSEGSSSNRLAQWCHGSPGMVLTFLSALQLFYPLHTSITSSGAAVDPLLNVSESVLLREVLDARKVVENFGLTDKGVGLCHGVSGNGIVLLTIHNFLEARYGAGSENRSAGGVAPLEETEADRRRHEEVLHQYLLVVLNYKSLRKAGLIGKGDRPLSLFEGTAGALMFLTQYLQLIEMGRPEIGFPAYWD